MPSTRRMGSPLSDSRNARTMGIPPATAASNRRSTSLASAAANSSDPKLASSSLLPVMTGLPWAIAERMNSRAGSMPPINSTTRSIVGSSTTPAASRVNTPGGSTTSRSRDRVRTATRVTSRRTPVEASMAPACLATSCTKAAPTLPHPRTPIRTTFSTVTSGQAIGNDASLAFDCGAEGLSFSAEMRLAVKMST
jgi:hypothetical protein